MICIFSSAFTDGTSVAGFHFHFISQDRTKDVHLLDFDITGAEARWDETPGYAVELPK